MKTLTINSDIFANEFAESFLKALMGNTTKNTRGVFCGWSSRMTNDRFFIVDKAFSGLHTPNSLSFSLDSLSVDWACLYNPHQDELPVWVLQSFIGGHLETIWSAELDLDYLEKQKGIEIK